LTQLCQILLYMIGPAQRLAPPVRPDNSNYCNKSNLAAQLHILFCVGGIRLLLADGHRICLAALASLLASKFQVVRAVHQGTDLIDSARELQPDVILSDILLPFPTAGDMVRKLKAESRRSKIVILTGQRDALAARRSFEAGAAAYILKQDEPAELISIIHRAARGERGLTSALLGEADDEAERGKLGILTPRQRQILYLLAIGRSQKEIAAILDVSTRTIEFHKHELMRRLAVRTTTELMAVAARYGIIDSSEDRLHLLPD
jgi:DNA-binding NarL/FixJ family response regulator